MLQEIQARVRAGDYHFTLHAGYRLTQRHISVFDVEDAVLSARAEIIEDYPDDPRGPSCLILGFTSDARPFHVQLSYPPHVAVVTAYEPNTEEWTNSRTRKAEDT